MNKSRKQLIANFINKKLCNYSGTISIREKKYEGQEIKYCYDVKETYCNFEVTNYKNSIDIKINEKIYIPFLSKSINRQYYFVTRFDEDDYKCYAIYCGKNLDGYKCYLIIKKEEMDKILLCEKDREKFYPEFMKIEYKTKAIFPVDNAEKIFDEYQCLNDDRKDIVVDELLNELFKYVDKSIYEGDPIDIVNNFKPIYYDVLVSMLEKYFLNGPKNFLKYLREYDVDEFKTKLDKFYKLEEENFHPIKYILFGMLASFLNSSGILDLFVKGE